MAPQHKKQIINAKKTSAMPGAFLGGRDFIGTVRNVTGQAFIGTFGSGTSKGQDFARTAGRRTVIVVP
jgi:hypothetical protein